MRIKIILALAIAALSAPLFAQQPVISIADSTGERRAVVAIVIPPAVTPTEVTARATEAAADVAPRPWTGRFIGQTKPINTCNSQAFCGAGYLEIQPDGTIDFVPTVFSLNYRTSRAKFVESYPVWNETLRRNFSQSQMGGGNCGRASGGYTDTYTTAFTIVPTGLSLTNTVPTGWDVQVANSSTRTQRC
jgi:hypothetical protein